MKNKLNKTAEHFNEKWWKEKKIMLRYTKIIPDLLKMLDGKFKNISSKTIATNRAYLTCKYICDNYNKNSNVLDMGCGLGFVSNVLAIKGFNVFGFDISSDAIDIAKYQSKKLKTDKANFFVDKEKILKKIKSNSINAAYGLGFIRYLNPKRERYVYRELRRILKKNGVLILDHQNELYEMFAFNSDTIKFWSDTIYRYSNKNLYCSPRKLNKIFSKKIKLPKRVKESHSISAKMKVLTENPLNYEKKMLKYKYKLLKIQYPYSNLVPPPLKKYFTEKKIEDLERKNCLKLSEDWKSMFMCFMFLTFLKKLDK